MRVFDCAQRSPEWHAIRCGYVTGSCANAIIAIRKKGTGELAIKRDLRERLVVERLTGIPANDLPYLPKDMQHGVDTEPEAVSAYEAETGEMVTRVGFVAHDELLAGCSPDGYVGDWQGIVEVKCPASSTHCDYLKADVIPDDYYAQLLHSLWITGAQWADFCSYDPRFRDERLRLFTKRLHRTSIDFTAYELAVRLFLTEVEHDVEALRAPREVANAV